MTTHITKILFGLIAEIIIRVVDLISFLVFIWCFLHWFPSIKWSEPPFKTLDYLVHPVIQPFKNILPPFGHIDLSPLLAIIALEFISRGGVYILTRPITPTRSGNKGKVRKKKTTENKNKEEDL